MRMINVLVLLSCIAVCFWSGMADERVRPRPKMKHLTDKIVVTIPAGDAPELQSKVTDSMHSISDVVRSLCDLAEDPRLDGAQTGYTFRAISMFSETVTVDRLIHNIDKKDTRGVVFGGYLGEYPAVTVLVGYGGPVYGQDPMTMKSIATVVGALGQDCSELKRKLLCDVLFKVLGTEVARKIVSSQLERKTLTAMQKKSYESALSDLEAR